MPTQASQLLHELATFLDREMDNVETFSGRSALFWEDAIEDETESFELSGFGKTCLSL